jgi:hypothetical protein
MLRCRPGIGSKSTPSGLSWARSIWESVSILSYFLENKLWEINPGKRANEDEVRKDVLKGTSAEAGLYTY